MEISEEYIEKLKVYLKNSRFLEIIKKLGIEADIDSITQYIEEKLNGRYIKEKAVGRFFKNIDIYMNNSELQRFEDGFIDFNCVLPIKKDKGKGGLRTYGSYLGQDGVEYIVKVAEGYKGPVSGMKFNKQGKYNPTIANAFFEFCGEQAAEAIPSLEKPPYYYIFSRNFLGKNQKTVTLEDLDYSFQYDSKENVSHKQIMSVIEQYTSKILSPYLSEEEIANKCQKIKLQYAIQETLKKMICSMDENLGNTSLVITNNKEGNIDVNISPAYDLDLSFNLGKEVLDAYKYSSSNELFYRTNNEGNTEIEDIIKEFINLIPGYKEKFSQIINRFDGDYINQIFEIAYKNTKLTDLKSDNLKQPYESFIMNRIANIKAIINGFNKMEEKQVNK